MPRISRPWGPPADIAMRHIGGGKGRAHALAPVVASTIALAALSLPGPPPVGADGPTLSVEPASTSAGSTIVVQGTGFGQHQHGDLSLDGVGAGMPDFHADAAGSFSVSVAIPASTASGTHTIAAPQAPYINSLASHAGLATNYDAVAHPSEPNYIALWSGSTQGVTDDNIHDLPGTNLADQLGAHGRSWRVFAQNVPLGCFTGTSASGGPDGAGSYVRRHEPAISFTDVSRSASRCSDISDFSHFDPAAADFELIVPNTCNDMHDCSIETGDAWLSSFVPRITSSAAFSNSVLYITWDEGTTSTGGGGHVATLVVSPHTSAGARSSAYHDHYSLLRTVQDAWGLGCLANTCGANDLREFFTR